MFPSFFISSPFHLFVHFVKLFLIISACSPKSFLLFWPLQPQFLIDRFLKKNMSVCLFFGSDMSIYFRPRLFFCSSLYTHCIHSYVFINSMFDFSLHCIHIVYSFVPLEWTEMCTNFTGCTHFRRGGTFRGIFPPGFSPGWISLGH